MKILKIMFAVLIVLAVASFSVLALTEDKTANEKEAAAVLI